MPDAAVAREIDAGGAIGIPGFVEPHIHLDKALINEDVRANKTGTLTEAIEIIWERKRAYTVDEVASRAARVMELAIYNGTKHIRTHVDVDTIGGLKPLEGVLAAKQRYRHLIDVEVVAFPQEGIIKCAGTEELMRKAMEMGANVVGGMPFNEQSPVHSWRHIEIAFDIARQYGAPIDMHVDETDDPGARTLEMLAEQTIANAYEGRVVAGHTCALAAYPDAYAARVIAKVKAASIHMVTLPATNLLLQGRLDREPRRRGITRVKELLSAGVNVTFGQDCVRDTFYPFGVADLLEVASIAAHAAQMSVPDEIETVFEMCTTNAARACGISQYGFELGSPADLVIIDARTPAEAIFKRADRRWVIRRGTILTETQTTRTAHWEAAARAAGQF
jgi:cytosine deaminase